MSEIFEIPPQAAAAQARSSNPKASVWVSANAGSGKTHVLTERVIRLLLRGTPPARILCLTYTKAAAANMQSRIFSRLSEWALLDDSALSAVLEALENSKPDILKLNQARRLFACALETPGGLKIQTIHAFCESLLHQFPLEANIAEHFEMMDDSAQAACMAAIKKQLFAELHLQQTGRLYAAFTAVLQQAGEDALHKLLTEALAHKQDLSRYCAYLSENGKQFWTQLFGLEKEAEQAKKMQTDIKTVLMTEIKQHILWSEAELTKITAFGGSRAADFAAKIKNAAIEGDTGKLVDIMLSAYFKSDSSPKDPVWLFGKKALSAWAEVADIFSEKAQIAKIYADKWNSLFLTELNTAAYILIQDLLKRYHTIKRARGLLDFGDLISRVLALLKRNGGGQWVQYKLDQGIDHILVDEAQDTGPEQWEIIRLLSQDFFSGLGIKEDLTRTLFAVGDEKQSIYSFQGAAPRDFAENGSYIARKAHNASMLFRRENLAFSFRSADEILYAVDKTFAAPQNYQGLSAQNTPPVHSAVRLNKHGYVDIWPAFSGEKQEEPQDWTEKSNQETEPAVKCAEYISAHIADWLQNNEILEGKNRPVRAGDIMILVRKRGVFVHALTRSLKNRNIAVAGADRLRLTDHIAIQDLAALGDFVLQPRDDLSLASILKSPLFNISEETLQFLAAERTGTLFAALEQSVRQNSLPMEQQLLTDALEKLNRYRAFADIKPVYEFYDKVLAEDGGRRKFLAHLGNAAGDILDAFSEYCLSAQKTALPGLQSFLHELRNNSPEIKRELDQNRDEIRIMTVHAAKGLEAPIVFLADGGSAVWHSHHMPALLPLPLPAKYRAGEKLPKAIRLWLPKANYKTALTEQISDRLKQDAEEEYRRLLYVAMTRAEDRLILCGYHGARAPQDTWLPLVSQALSDEAQVFTYKSGMDVLRLGKQPKAAKAEIQPEAAYNNRQTKSADLPAFLIEKPQPEPALPHPLASSGAAFMVETELHENPNFLPVSPILGDIPANIKNEQISDRGEHILKNIEKGIFIHNLLQYLPDTEPKLRKKLAKNYLNIYCGKAENEILRREILQNVFAVLNNEKFSDLFGPSSRAETALQGFISVKGKKRAVSARIDRLALFDDYILFADYKTGYAPNKAEDIPAVYKMQMALYTALLQALYPQKSVRSLLIYTNSGLIFPFTEKELLPLLA